MDDLISKQEALNDLSEPFVMSQCLTVEECETMNRARKLCLARVGRIEPVQRWIPVTERLPENGQIVVAVGEKGTWDVGMFTGLAFSNLDPSEWNWKKNTIKTVKWWMLKKDALPEPPKEEA